MAGAGRSTAEAARPAVLQAPDGKRLLIFALACPSSGVPPHWQAWHDRPGVTLLTDLGEPGVTRIADEVATWSSPDDLVMVSIHWGPNWGWKIPRQHRRFAHAVIAEAGVDIVHGHSSHHPMAIELFQGRPILYGCGDLINDYEGIGGLEAFRPNLAVAYFAEIEARTGLRHLDLVPFRRHRFRLTQAAPGDVAWLQEALTRDCRSLGAAVRKERGALRISGT